MQKLHTISIEKKLTCIVNLHQVDYAKKYATRIIGIKQGMVVFDGAPSQLTDEMVRNIYEGKESQMTLQAGNHPVSLAVGQNNE